MKNPKFVDQARKWKTLLPKFWKRLNKKLYRRLGLWWFQFFGSWNHQKFVQRCDFDLPLFNSIQWVMVKGFVFTLNSTEIENDVVWIRVFFSYLAVQEMKLTRTKKTTKKKKTVFKRKTETRLREQNKTQRRFFFEVACLWILYLRTDWDPLCSLPL